MYWKLKDRVLPKFRAEALRMEVEQLYLLASRVASHEQEGNAKAYSRPPDSGVSLTKNIDPGGAIGLSLGLWRSFLFRLVDYIRGILCCAPPLR